MSYDIGKGATVDGPVAVLGGSGFIGRAIVEQLSLSREVISVDRSSAGPHDHVRHVVADVTDSDQLDAVLAGVSTVVYAVGALSPAESTSHPADDVTVSLGPLLHVLEHLRRHPQRSLVFLSSGGAVYGNPPVIPVGEEHPVRPISAYGVLKLAAERYVDMYQQVHGVHSRVLRVANAYGPGQLAGRSQGLIANAVAAVVEDRPFPVYGSGRSVRDYIHVADVALAVQAAIDADGPWLVNVATGIGTSTRQILHLLEEISGRRIEVIEHPARPFDVDAIVLDPSAFVAMVGIEPVALADGLRETYRAHISERDAHTVC